MNRTLLTILLGALGGFLGFACSELLSPQSQGAGLTSVMWETACWTALFVLPLTLVLGITENLLGLRGRWSHGLGRIILPAILLGAVSGAIAQFFYSVGLSMDISGRLMRALGWGVMGIGVGLALGLLDRSWAKGWRGALGGAVGGFIAGLVFDSLPALPGTGGDSAVLARLVGLTLLGAAIGFMLRLSQELFKSSWLMGTTTGKYEGKQYVLIKSAVTVGRGLQNDISLPDDSDVSPTAGVFRRQGQTWSWEGEGALINHRAVRTAVLNHGDRLRFGNTELLFQEKRAVAANIPFTEELALHSNEEVVRLPIPLKRVIVGTEGDVKVRGQNIQPRHAEITVSAGGLMLRALGSVTLNDRPLTAGEQNPIRTGDLIRLGSTEFALLRV